MPSNINFYDRDSRYYKNINVAKFKEGEKVPLLINDIRFISDDIESYYSVPPNEEARLDTIAFKIYGNTQLWWVLARANYIEDITTEPMAGELLAIPSSAAIRRYM